MTKMTETAIPTFYWPCFSEKQLSKKAVGSFWLSFKRTFPFFSLQEKLLAESHIKSKQTNVKQHRSVLLFWVFFWGSPCMMCDSLQWLQNEKCLFDCIHDGWISSTTQPKFQFPMNLRLDLRPVFQAAENIWLVPLLCKTINMHRKVVWKTESLRWFCSVHQMGWWCAVWSQRVIGIVMCDLNSHPSNSLAGHCWAHGHLGRWHICQGSLWSSAAQQLSSSFLAPASERVQYLYIPCSCCLRGSLNCSSSKVLEVCTSPWRA